MPSLRQRVCTCKQQTGFLLKGLLLSGKAGEKESRKRSGTRYALLPSTQLRCVRQSLLADKQPTEILFRRMPKGKSQQENLRVLSQEKRKGANDMQKFITDERTGLQYELVGDYYLIAGEDEPESRLIGVWGQRHLRYLKQHRKVLYSNLLISGKLNDYLADINEQAEDMFSRLVKQLAEKESVTEALKAENQMLWVQRMNNIRSAAMEIVSSELIYC